MARKPRTKDIPTTSGEEQVHLEPADEVDPYGILSIEETATQDQIKTAYRKAALKYHPDKVKPDEKDEANRRFQEIATAYAILSDEKRRRRYDTTGNTSESLDDDEFDWTDFFRAQSDAMISGDLIEQLKAEYQHSGEERDDVIEAYKDGKGNMDLIYETVMCSSVLDDDERFRKYIDEAILAGTVKTYPNYAGESKGKKRKRLAKAKGEEEEAMQLAEELGVKEKLFGHSQKEGKGNSKKAGDGDDALRALIQQRSKARSDDFLDRLEEKYAGGKKPKRKGRDEPPEELFQRNSKKSRGQ